MDPSDVSVLDRRRYDRLVLTACHPLYSAEERIVVFARLVAHDAEADLRPGSAVRSQGSSDDADESARASVVADIKQRVQDGTYVLDERRVAEAVLQRLGASLTRGRRPPRSAGR